MSALGTADDVRDSALAELALRQLRRDHPVKWREAVGGDAAVAGWFEDQIRDVYLRRSDRFEVAGPVVQLAIIAERRKELSA